MLPKELLKNVKRIQITTNRLATDVFSGQYHSVFKGRGMEFDEVREYQLGDDIRSIDWNVTARTGRPHVKKFVEEREMTVMVLVDVSMSCRFASVRQLKSKLAAEIAAVLAFSAIKNNDKVGLIIFTDRIEKFIPPRKGLKHVLRVIREVLYYKPQGKGTDLNSAIEFLNKVTTRRAVAFFISDFFPPNLHSKFCETRQKSSILGGGGNERLKRTLAIANKRHDVIAVTLNDPAEMDLPLCGLFEVEDAETGQRRLIDSSDYILRKQYKKEAIERISLRDAFFNSIGVDHIDLSTDTPYTQELVKFFLKRRRKLAR